MSTTAHAASGARGEEHRCHHTASGQWIDVDGIADGDRPSMGCKDSFDHLGVARKSRGKGDLDVVGS